MSLMRATPCRILLLAGLVLPGAFPFRAIANDGMARLPADTIALPFREKPSRVKAPGDTATTIDTLRAVKVAVPAFRIDRRAVTHGEFLAFVRTHPRFMRSRVSPAVADGGYLRTWRGDLEPPEGRDSEPVTGVSWYAAKAYCAAQGKRLPTTAEWERVAATYPDAVNEGKGRAADSVARERAILAWYGGRDADSGAAAPGGTRHADGVTGLFGVIWEWTADFNAWSGSGVNARGVRAPGDGSKDDSKDIGSAGPLTCGGAPAGMTPNTSYATYMRWGFRASLSPEYTVATLGFRCANDDERNAP